MCETHAELHGKEVPGTKSDSKMFGEKWFGSIGKHSELKHKISGDSDEDKTELVPLRKLVTLYNILRDTHSGAELQYKTDAFYIPSKSVSL